MATVATRIVVDFDAGHEGAENLEPIITFQNNRRHIDVVNLSDEDEDEFFNAASVIDIDEEDEMNFKEAYSMIDESQDEEDRAFQPIQASTSHNNNFQVGPASRLQHAPNVIELTSRLTSFHQSFTTQSNEQHAELIIPTDPTFHEDLIQDSDSAKDYLGRIKNRPSQYARQISDRFSRPLLRFTSPEDEDEDSLDLDLGVFAGMENRNNSKDEPIDLTEDDDPQYSFNQVLSLILEILPDICEDYVRKLYDKHSLENLVVDPERLIEDILKEENYVKKKKTIKRKRTDDDEDDPDEKAHLAAVIQSQHVPETCKVLQLCFPNAKADWLLQILKMKKTLYDTITTIRHLEKYPNSAGYPRYDKLKQARRGGVKLENIMDPVLRQQFERVQRKIASDEATKERQKQEAEEEAEATKRAIELEDVSECGCCFDTLPNIKIVVCDADHPFCFDCIAGHVKAQLELQKHEITCMDGSGCKAPFSRQAKKKALNDQTFERLERVQQQNELRESGLDLSECPFCDFAAIYPPIEEDREFRCQAEDCGVTSCRLCKKASHTPMSCEEFKKSHGVDQRHQVEEEMTKALLRTCDKCKAPIIKEGGCNKITCSVCHSHICDVCGKDITKEGYSHFGRPPKNCPQMDAGEGHGRTAERVKQAQEQARRQVLEKNPELSAEDLEIKLSERAKAAEARNHFHDPRQDAAAILAAHRQHAILAGDPRRRGDGFIGLNHLPLNQHRQPGPAAEGQDQLRLRLEARREELAELNRRAIERQNNNYAQVQAIQQQLQQQAHADAQRAEQARAQSQARVQELLEARGHAQGQAQTAAHANPNWQFGVPQAQPLTVQALAAHQLGGRTPYPPPAAPQFMFPGYAVPMVPVPAFPYIPPQQPIGPGAVPPHMLWARTGAQIAVEAASNVADAGDDNEEQENRLPGARRRVRHRRGNRG